MVIHMEYTAIGKIIKMTGGLYTVRLHSAGQTPAGPLAGQTVECRARGGFRHAGLRPLVGDNAEVSYSDSSVEQTPDGIRPTAPGWFSRTSCRAGTASSVRRLPIST